MTDDPHYLRDFAPTTSQLAARIGRLELLIRSLISDIVMGGVPTSRETDALFDEIQRARYEHNE